MKIINFHDAVTPQQQRAFRQWFGISLILFVITIGIIGYIESKQIFTYYQTKNSCSCFHDDMNRFNTVSKDIEKLKQEEKELQERLTLLSRQKEQAKQRVAQLEVLQKICTNKIILQSYSSNERGIEMSLIAPSITDVNQALSSLAQSSLFPRLALVAMRPHDNGFLFVAKNH